MTLFQEQVENDNLSHFPSRDVFHNNGGVRYPFESVHTAEMIEPLTEN
jgi:hypothetical protein